MMKQFRRFLVNLIAGANVTTVVLMLLVGYSDRLSPVEHPLLCCAGMAMPFFLLANMAFLFFWLLFCWRKAWIPVAGFLLAYVPIRIYCPLNFSSAPPEGALKLMTYNVCTYGGNFKYEDAVDRIMDYLDRESPDIVCFQEDVSNKREVRRKLADRYAYNDTVLFCRNAEHENAVGIHTRFPILRRERIEYTSVTNGSAAWFLQVGKDTVVVVNNHLESTHISTEDREKYQNILKGDVQRREAHKEGMLLVDKLGSAMVRRAPEAEAVHRFIENHRQYPVIVCGDFNDTPISYTRHVISQGLTDCFRETGKGLGLSYNRKGFNFRIDYLFCSSHFEPAGCWVDSKVDYSDHYPLVGWLKMKDYP